MQTVTTCGPHAMLPGDSITLDGDTNRMRRKVSEITGYCQFEVQTFIRPSRGYARHVRRQKSKARI